MKNLTEQQLLDKDLLMEYGFKVNELKTKELLTVMTKDKFDIVVAPDGSVFYSNMGFDYPLKDLSALKKLYKEILREELTTVKQ